MEYLFVLLVLVGASLFLGYAIAMGWWIPVTLVGTALVTGTLFCWFASMMMNGF